MEFHDFCIAWKRYFKVIAAVTSIAVLSTWIVSQLLVQAVYESKSTIIVNGKEAQPSDTEVIYIFEKYVIKVFTQISESDAVEKDVINKLNINSSVREFRRLIDITVDEDTGIMKLSARTNDAKLSQDIVLALIASITKRTQSFMPNTSVHVIDAPLLQSKPTSPNLPLNLLLSLTGGILSGVLIAILSVLKEQARYDISALHQFQWLFHLGSVPNIKSKNGKKWQPVFPESGLASEALKAIRTNLLYLLDHHAIKTILVTSPESSEGKTTISINIAVSVSQLDRRVLLVECNFKNPSLDKMIRLFCDPTNSEELLYRDANGYLILPIHHPGSDAIFDVMLPPIYPDSDYSLLNATIEKWKNVYDLIVLDSPPVMSNADTLMLSKIANHVVLVADYRKLTFAVLKKTTYRLTQIGARIQGIVINHVPEKKIP